MFGALFFKECKQVLRSLVYFIYVVVFVLFITGQMSSERAMGLQAPVPGQSDYGTAVTTDETLIMEGTLAGLVEDIYYNSWVTYPLGFYKAVTLTDREMEQAEAMGQWAFVPAAAGFWIGILFLLLLDKTIPHLHMNSSKAEGPKSSFGRSTMLVLAVTLHNLPEGMAVGVVYAGWLSGDAGITAMGALALSLGIAIQNFPEGAIISMPLRAEGAGRGKAFLYGALSGAVEPIGAALTLLAAHYVVPFLPYLLSFAAGAMVYVVVEELIPEMSEGKHSNLGTILFAAGFTIMMALDVALG